VNHHSWPFGCRYSELPRTARETAPPHFLAASLTLLWGNQDQPKDPQHWQCLVPDHTKAYQSIHFHGCIWARQYSLCTTFYLLLCTKGWPWLFQHVFL
jgi:hypothetical protein